MSGTIVTSATTVILAAPAHDKHATLREVLDEACAQAVGGKGKERHAGIDEAFEDQQIVQLGEWMETSIHPAINFNVGQCAKKALEATRLPHDRAISELEGAINYLAGAVIILKRQVERARLLAEDTK